MLSLALARAATLREVDSTESDCCAEFDVVNSMSLLEVVGGGVRSTYLEALPIVPSNDINYRQCQMYPPVRRCQSPLPTSFFKLWRIVETAPLDALLGKFNGQSPNASFHLRNLHVD